MYDAETGFYYLQSRYYDPEVGRFISADGRISDVGGEILGNNMFAYCFNNPINMYDSTGGWPQWATIALGVAAATLAVAATVFTLGALAPAAACTLTVIGMSYGVSYTTAATIASVVTATTVIAAATYAGDSAYASVTGKSNIKEVIFNGDDEAYYLSAVFIGMAASGLVGLASFNAGICFVEGTKVLSSEGYIAIEDIAVGDYVWAEETATGEKALKKVVNTFINQTDELVHVYVNGEEIYTKSSILCTVKRMG